MRHLLIAVLLAALAPLSIAADWTKPYFGATQPGSWAKHKSTSTIGPASFVTYTRLPDENGQVVIDQFAEFNSKDAPPSTMRYTLEAGFKADRELIDFLRAITAASASVGAKDAPFTELPADTVNAIKNMPAYATTAAFQGAERVDGKNCDRYTYTRNHSGQQVEIGEIWLSAAVPFGLVKQTMTFKDASGAVMYTGLTVLVDSGTKK
jgi:hypothetical protein